MPFYQVRKGRHGDTLEKFLWERLEALCRESGVENMPPDPLVREDAACSSVTVVAACVSGAIDGAWF